MEYEEENVQLLVIEPNGDQREDDLEDDLLRKKLRD